MRKWHDALPLSAESADASGFVVVEAKLQGPANLSAWELKTLSRASVIDSEVAVRLLAWLEASKKVQFDSDDDLQRADLQFEVNEALACRIQGLLDRLKVRVTGFPLSTTELPPNMRHYVATSRSITRDKKTRAITAATLTLPPTDASTQFLAKLATLGLKVAYTDFSNSYRFTNCKPIPNQPGRYLATANLAYRPSGTGQGKKKKPKLNWINETLGLQALLTDFSGIKHYAQERGIRPDMLAGIAQVAAQELTSYIGQLDCDRITGKIKFPSVENRNPAERRAAWKQSLQALSRDLRPLEQQREREIDPSKYASEDSRGDRLVTTDERWLAVTRRVEPNQYPLFFVTGSQVRIFESRANLPTDIVTRTRHASQSHWRSYRPDETPSAAQRAGKQTVALRQYYAAIPLLSPDPEIRQAFTRHDVRKTGRGLDLKLQPVRLMGQLTQRKQQIHTEDLLAPLQSSRRMENLFHSGAYCLRHSRVLRRQGEWFLQLTLEVALPKLPKPANLVLGVAFGLDASAFWCLVEKQGKKQASGRLAPNQNIQKFLERKGELEWDQRQGRWIGGRQFAGELELIAHHNCDRLLRLADIHQADLSVQDIAWVAKQSRDSASNVLFTALNYGQMRSFLDYKAPHACLRKPWSASGYATSHTCPICHSLTRGEDAASPAKRVTFWDKEAKQLCCRHCSYRGVPSDDDRAYAAALDLLYYVRR